MFKKISLLVFLSIPLMILADDHGKKEGKSPKEMKKMEMIKKKKDDMMKEMERWGRWKPEAVSYTHLTLPTIHRV